VTFKPEQITFLASVAHVLSQAIGQRRSEAAVQRSESWLRHLVATTQDAVVSIDRRGCVVLFNTSAERIFGYTAGEIVGRKVNILMAEPYASEHDGYVARYERTREPHAIGRIRKVTAKRKDGAEFPVELSVTEIEVDEEVHYAAFLRDVSETVELHARAVENERLAAIGGTAARIGHEIANPLNGIYLTLQLLEQKLAREPADERVAADILKVKREVARLNQLVQEFRTLARKQTYRFRPTHPLTLLNEVVDLQRPVCEASGIRVVLSSAADLPAVDIDEDKLKQALLNVLKNAIEAMAHGGKLTIEADRNGDDIIIAVSDTGTGITPDRDVFAPFFTTKKEGSGLGLIIVRQIVAAHGGAITYDSRAGEGTTFRITLPLSSRVRINFGE
jgi:two-component system sensor kinase FixL